MNHTNFPYCIFFYCTEFCNKNSFMVIRMADGLCEEQWVVESQRLKERDDNPLNHVWLC